MLAAKTHSGARVCGHNTNRRNINERLTQPNAIRIISDFTLKRCLCADIPEQLTVGPYLVSGAAILLWLFKQAVFLHEAIFTGLFAV